MLSTRHRAFLETGESLPVGETGRMTHILPWEFRKGEANGDVLAVEQSPGLQASGGALPRVFTGDSRHTGSR